jgi:hypothetical protein
MTTNKKDSVSEKKGRVKVGKLQVNKETIKDLTDKEAERIKGGNPQATLTTRALTGLLCSNTCPI